MKLKKLIEYLERTIKGFEDNDMEKEITEFKINIEDKGISCILTAELTKRGQTVK